MGKFLVGCVVVVFVLAVGAGGVGYFFFIKPAVDFGQDVARFGQEYQEIEQQIENRDPYQPPSDREVTQDQFDRFLAAQRYMRQELEGSLTELQEKYQEMDEEIKAEDRDIEVRELMEAYRGLGDLLIDTRRTQVQAMNEHGFSQEEYVWVRNQVYQAIGESVAVGMGQFTEDEQPDRGDRVHPNTIEMVEPHKEELMESHVLAWWGF